MLNNILFPIDINDNKSWKRSFAKVAELSETIKDCNLTILHVIPTYGLGMMEEYFPKDWAKEVKSKSMEKLQTIVDENLPKKIKTTLIIDKGTVYQSIIAQAEKMDASLIIMSAHHPDRGDHLLGPNASKVVGHTTKSVLVLRD